MRISAIKPNFYSYKTEKHRIFTENYQITIEHHSFLQIDHNSNLEKQHQATRGNLF